MTPEFIAELDAAVKAARKLSEGRIANYRRYIAQEEERMAKAEEKLTPIFEMMEQLTEAGFAPVWSDWSGTVKVDTTSDRLPELCAITGVLDVSQLSKELKDAKKRIARVSVPTVRFPFLYVEYDAPVPKEPKTPDAPKPKCRIVTERVPAKTVRKLVCDV